MVMTAHVELKFLEGTIAGKLYKSGQKPSKSSKQASRSSSSSGSKKQNNRSHGTERKPTRGGNFGRGR